MVLVLPGFDEVLARFFLSKNEFIKEDFPTLDLPAKAISSKLSFGNWETNPAT